ncbi:lytic polysaccharide monooxygenase [Periconia macrospinosa]|uniref:lytic cellulose monooxygenase (C4-dehydrogenating) n=1 Tax=Periconia macrospinosa TaxID=97972 RepID=A0A2V1E5F6_9PLEO|nr:lytic polysaccharide monooxygenase [Periconia macrospinosa]
MIFATIIAIGTFAFYASAHIVIPHLLVNKTDTGRWKHVLYGSIFLPFPPIQSRCPLPSLIIPLYANDEINKQNLTCGRAAFNSLPKTEIADVIAGEELGFQTWNEKDDGAPFTEESTYTFFHYGPGQVWLSRAPNDDLKSYYGDGDWFKVAYAGPEDNQTWKLDSRKHGIWKPINSYNFTLPRTTPPGAYLMRFEYIYPTSYNYSQFYVSCALVNIHSPDPSVKPGTPTGFAKFPGTYKLDDPGIEIPKNQDKSTVSTDSGLRLMEYKPPGPPVWTG